MARRTFFSFHFDKDVWRANQVRNCNVVAGADVAGFFDHSEYEEAKRVGPDAIRRMIRRHLENTTVTVVLIGEETASRPWVQFEIEESIKRRNGLLGIHIHHLPDVAGVRGWFRGPVPQIALGADFPTYDWDGDVHRLARAIENAGGRSDYARALRY